ncbi:MAG: serine/threonine-protein kinase, partial [Acidobacteriota bacterium]
LLAEEEEALTGEFLEIPAALDMGIGLVPRGSAGLGSAAEDPLAESDRVGPYRIVEELGRGGMGTVYLAEQDRPIQRRVALKVVHGFGAQGGSRRFAAECRALARLKHPNIAAVYDAGVADEGRAFVSMEWIEGDHITDWCDGRSLSIRDRLVLFLDVCAGVAHAHQKGLVHRDLKPSNVLVSEVDGAAVAKVIDFGIARSLDESEGARRQAPEDSIEDASAEEGSISHVTETWAGDWGPEPGDRRDPGLSHSLLVGSPIYMSPEAAALRDRSDVDTRTDVYSLGVLLYVLLVGKTPHEVPELGIGALLRTVQKADAPPPSTRWTDLDDGSQAELA